MILADTSAWVEYDRATGSSAHLRMRALIDTRGSLAITEPVIMELLVGVRTDLQEELLLRLLLRFELLPFQSETDFTAAARVYRRCREVGVTPRGTVDCMIAAVASRAGASLLAHDVDLVRIAQVMSIPLEEASLHLP